MPYPETASLDPYPEQTLVITLEPVAIPRPQAKVGVELGPLGTHIFGYTLDKGLHIQFSSESSRPIVSGCRLVSYLDIISSPARNRYY